MVLQRNLACPVWGTADPGEDVAVSIDGQSKTVKAGPDGKWSVKLDPMEAGESKTLIVKGKNEIQFENVAVGEVWIGSGQSNMAHSVINAIEPWNDIQAANFPNIRLITVPNVSAETPQDDFKGQWAPCTPQTVPHFSAVLFYFGRELSKELNVPIGLINCSWGGSSCEAWINTDVVAANPDYAQIMQRRKDFDPNNPNLRINHQVGLLYNAMLHPLIGYGIRGALWYQGETNAGRSYQHRTLFPCLIHNWREEWNQGDFPFYWVQLPNFMAQVKEPRNSGWAEFRESQTMTLSLPNTGQAVTINLGDAKDVHPRNKQDVAHRLALIALARDYGKEVDYEYPRFKSASFKDNQAEIIFENVDDGLVSIGALPTGFTVAGDDQVFHWASAKIVGKDKVVVTSDKVAKPVAVRYAWADNPVATLYGSDGQPLCPFRTDDWPGWTFDKK